MKKVLYGLFICFALMFTVVEARPVHIDIPDGSGSTSEEANDTRETYVKMQCGDSEIPYVAAEITHTIINVLQIVTPIIIIIFGSVDFMKAVMAQKEDEIKKNQKIFIRRLITGACVFLVFAIVKVVIGLLAPVNENEGMWKCVNCFVNGECETLLINQ